MTKNHPEGVTVVKSTPKSPVMITRLRTVGNDKQTLEMQLEQMFEAPLVNATSGALGFFMEGHSAFQNNGDRKRVAWQNISTVKAIGMGLITKWEDVGTASTEVFDTEGKSLGMKQGEVHPQNLELKIINAGAQIPVRLVVVDTYTPRTWKDSRTLETRIQSPRRAGMNGDVLMRDGKVIYRNAQLAMPGAADVNLGREWDEDYIITHNNPIVGSTTRAALAAANIAVGTVNTPGARASQADPRLQNAGIGQTSNLVHGATEPTRSGPDEQEQDVAEKTKAEEGREAGERSVVSEHQHEE